MSTDGGAGNWVSRHKWLTAPFIVLFVLGCEAEPEASPARGSVEQESAPRDDRSSEDAPTQAEPKEEPSAGEADQEPKRRDGTARDRSGGQAGSREPKPKPAPKPAPESEPSPVQSFLVTRVIDGDTLELASGQDVRLVGIDTPEVGECGYDKATANLAYLVAGKQVRLTRSDEDRDRYGRLLRYVNVGDVDAGLRLIKNGLAIARYDSRDGYGFHQREPVYIAADKGKGNINCPKPQPVVTQPAPSGCAPGYSPCVPPYPPDVDCPDVNGPIQVTGTDPHGLDADGDGGLRVGAVRLKPLCGALHRAAASHERWR